MLPGIDLGFVTIRFYGIIIMVGALAAAWVAEREARRRGLNSELVWDGLIWVLIAGIIGARIWHILTPPPSMIAIGKTTEFYLTHPLDAIAIWEGGLGIPGAVIGGIIALYFFSRRNKLSFPMWADIAAPALALGQAIGRWGNFFNQELYGAPTDLPWAVHIDPMYRLPGFADEDTYHPLFLYESLWSLANFAFLLWLGRRYPERLKPGDLFLVYLIIYPVGRFFLEFLRLDASQIAGLNANQTLMAIVALVAAGLLAWRHRKQPQPVLEESH
jgi:phosphatidylglycerol:prolipoprotein diacylglycerol transferase